MAKRDTYGYVLHEGKKTNLPDGHVKYTYKPTYIGITNNPERRKEEHIRDKDLSKNLWMQVDKYPKTRESAKKTETKNIVQHEHSHNGNKPKHNKIR